MSDVNVREGSDNDVSRLERRARRLLRAYPPGYRADRGEEVLGTLLEAAPPGRGWPQAREVASVTGGGLRARRDANRRQGTAASLRQAAVLGITVYLAGVMSNVLLYLESGVSSWEPLDPVGWRLFLPIVPLAATLTAAWAGRRRLAAAAAVVAGAACAYTIASWISRLHTSWISQFHTGVDASAPALGEGLLVPLLSLAALVLLTRSTQRPPTSWLWLPCLFMGVAVLNVLAGQLGLGPAGHVLGWPGNWAAPWQNVNPHFPEIMAAMCACWLVTDSRPLAGLALGLALTEADSALGNIPSSLVHAGITSTLKLYWQELTVTAVPLAVATAIAWLLHRRTRISPPTTS